MTDRLTRERMTVRLMIEIYCRGHHHRDGLCSDCAELMRYVEMRLASCPFQVQKPTCLLCRTHCYAPSQRTLIRQVMRYSGPRMLLLHPVLTLRHWLDGLKGAPTTTKQSP